MVSDEELDSIVEQMKKRDAQYEAADIIYKSRGWVSIYVAAIMLAIITFCIGLLIGGYISVHDIQHYIKTTSDNSTIILNTITNMKAV